MESYEKEWLATRPVEHAIMHIVGLFDRPASGDCLGALRTKPAIQALTDVLVDLDEDQWQRAIARPHCWAPDRHGDARTVVPGRGAVNQ
jgi:hypothetical protein